MKQCQAPIEHFLPFYEKQERRIQVDLPASLAEKADKIRKSRRLTWAEVVVGLMEKFVEDLGPAKIKPDQFKLNEVNLDPPNQTDMQSFWK